jgi:hypothetical protein
MVAGAAALGTGFVLSSLANPRVVSHPLGLAAIGSVAFMVGLLRAEEAGHLNFSSIRDFTTNPLAELFMPESQPVEAMTEAEQQAYRLQLQQQGRLPQAQTQALPTLAAPTAPLTVQAPVAQPIVNPNSPATYVKAFNAELLEAGWQGIGFTWQADAGRLQAHGATPLWFEFLSIPANVDFLKASGLMTPQAVMQFQGDVAQHFFAERAAYHGAVASSVEHWERHIAPIVPDVGSYPTGTATVSNAEVLAWNQDAAANGNPQRVLQVPLLTHISSQYGTTAETLVTNLRFPSVAAVLPALQALKDAGLLADSFNTVQTWQASMAAAGINPIGLVNQVFASVGRDNVVRPDDTLETPPNLDANAANRLTGHTPSVPLGVTREVPAEAFPQPGGFDTTPPTLPPHTGSNQRYPDLGVTAMPIATAYDEFDDIPDDTPTQSAPKDFFHSPENYAMPDIPHPFAPDYYPPESEGNPAEAIFAKTLELAELPPDMTPEEFINSVLAALPAIPVPSQTDSKNQLAGLVPLNYQQWIAYTIRGEAAGDIAVRRDEEASPTPRLGSISADAHHGSPQAASLYGPTHEPMGRIALSDGGTATIHHEVGEVFVTDTNSGEKIGSLTYLDLYCSSIYIDKLESLLSDDNNIMGELITIIQAWANDTHQTVIIHAKPPTDNAMSLEQLRQYYIDRGFTPTRGDPNRFVYTPQ